MLLTLRAEPEGVREHHSCQVETAAQEHFPPGASTVLPHPWVPKTLEVPAFVFSGSLILWPFLWRGEDSGPDNEGQLGL